MNGLTKRQWEVAQMVRDGMTLSQISANLSIAESTTHEHIQAITKKLGAESSRQIPLILAKYQILDRIRQLRLENTLSSFLEVEYGAKSIDEIDDNIELSKLLKFLLEDVITQVESND